MNLVPESSCPCICDYCLQLPHLGSRMLAPLPLSPYFPYEAWGALEAFMLLRARMVGHEEGLGSVGARD